jgi:hypothetical protein
MVMYGEEEPQTPRPSSKTEFKSEGQPLRWPTYEEDAEASPLRAQIASVDETREASPPSLTEAREDSPLDVQIASDDDDELRRLQTQAKRAREASPRNAEVISSDDDEDEAPRRLPEAKPLTASAPMKKKARKAPSAPKEGQLYKAELKALVESGDSAALLRRSKNSNGETYSVIHTMHYPMAKPLGPLSPLPLAIKCAFAASRSEREGVWPKTLEMVRTLVVECCAKPSETKEGWEEWLQLLVVKLPAAVPRSEGAKVGVLSLLLTEDDAFLEGAESTLNALSYLVADMMDDMMRVVCMYRKDRLKTHEDIFEAVAIAIERETTVLTEDPKRCPEDTVVACALQNFINQLVPEADRYSNEIAHTLLYTAITVGTSSCALAFAWGRSLTNSARIL